MSRSLILLAFSAAVAIAQTTTVNVLIPGYDPEQTLVASVVDASPALTTFVVNCAEGTTDANECGVPDGGATFVQGPSTWSMHQSYTSEDESYENDFDCKLDKAKDRAVCNVKAKGSYGKETFATTTTETIPSLAALMVPVTVTAGADLLGAAPDAATTEADRATETVSETGTTVTRANAEATVTEIDAETTATQPTSSATESSDEAASTSNTENAAFPRATHNAILAGVAAVVGGAWML